MLVLIFGRRQRKMVLRLGREGVMGIPPLLDKAGLLEFLSWLTQEGSAGVVIFFILSLMYEILWGFKQNDFQELFRDEGTDCWVSRILGF